MPRSRRKNRIRAVASRHNLDASNVPFNAEIAADEVDNPYREGPARIPVTRSIRDDPLGGLFVRKQIGGEEYAAGRKFQFHYDRAGVGLIAAMDPLKEPVDGGGAGRRDITADQLMNFQVLDRAKMWLGGEGYRITTEVLVEGATMREIAGRRGYASQLANAYYGMRFRECLRTLATGWGLIAGQLPLAMRGK